MRAFESLADSFSVPGAGQRHYSANRNEVVSTKPESVLTDCDLRGERVPMSQQNRSRIGVGGLGSRAQRCPNKKGDVLQCKTVSRAKTTISYLCTPSTSSRHLSPNPFPAPYPGAPKRRPPHQKTALHKKKALFSSFLALKRGA